MTAIGPSAGWVSFQSYGGAAGGTGGTPQEEMVRRAASPSDTVKLAKNCTGLGVFILHGASDDNVPATVLGALEAVEQLAVVQADEEVLGAEVEVVLQVR